MSTYKPYRAAKSPPERDPQWSKIRSALLQSNREFHDAKFSANEAAGNQTPLKDPPLVGAAYGRLWEIAYRRPTYFSPDQLINVTTAIRWDEPEKMVLYETPWLYIGGRRRIFSRASPDIERIFEKQRHAERNLEGYQTGDPEFDRRWAVYAYRSRPSEVVRDPGRRQWLTSLADLRRSQRDEMPTIASLGTTVGLGAVISDSEDTVRFSSTLVQTFSQLLDDIELSTGNAPASRLPLTMDLLPDGTGYPSPTLRLRCPRCGQETHPRFVPDFQTEICTVCRKGLYSTW